MRNNKIKNPNQILILVSLCHFGPQSHLPSAGCVIFPVSRFGRRQLLGRNSNLKKRAQKEQEKLRNCLVRSWANLQK